MPVTPPAPTQKIRKTSDLRLIRQRTNKKGTTFTIFTSTDQTLYKDVHVSGVPHYINGKPYGHAHLTVKTPGETTIRVPISLNGTPDENTPPPLRLSPHAQEVCARLTSQLIQAKAGEGLFTPMREYLTAQASAAAPAPTPESARDEKAWPSLR